MEAELFQHVLFTSDFDQRDIKTGWIVCIDKKHSVKYPIIIAIQEEYRKVAISFDEFNSYPENKKENYQITSDKLIHKHDNKFEKNFYKFQKYFDFSIVSSELSYTNELINLYKNGFTNILVKSMLIKLKRSILFVLSFIWSVCILGTLQIAFGNFFSLYYSRYKRIRLRKQHIEIQRNAAYLKLIDEMSGRESHPNYDAENKIIEEIKTVNNDIANSSNNILTMIIALTGLIISIIALQK